MMDHALQPLPIELNHVSFSRRGSYLAITARDEAQCRANAHLHIRPGLWLRHFHDEGRRDAFHLTPIVGGKPVDYTAEAMPDELRLDCAGGCVRFCISDVSTLRIRCEGVGLRLSMLANLSAGEFGVGEGRLRVNAGGTLHDFTFSRLAGEVNSRREVAGDQRFVLVDLTPGGDDGIGECALVQSKGQPQLPSAWDEFEACRRVVQADFQRFLTTHASVEASLEAPAYLAAYISWSTYVSPCGHFKRPAMLMSKNWMANVWSWDHCFNALGLAEHEPAAAWDQFMCIFDHQLPNGQLPDMINDTVLQYNHVKPPIHGWAYRWMMRANDWFTAPARLAEVYECLARWTDWWFEYRDPEGTGLPVYHHGNDSGWDNGTVFDVGQPTRGPDCAAFLVLQMDVLADLADRLGRTDAAAGWRRRAEATVAALLERLWIGDRFVTRHATSGQHNEKSRSIINCMPLMIADRLPADVREATLARLKENLTDWGLATESPDSQLYESDGYWRGPIWASPTLLLIDGLGEMGQTDFAEAVADRFRRMCVKSGFSENYDAVTGGPLRDQSYTWTSSAFLILARQRGGSSAVADRVL